MIQIFKIYSLSIFILFLFVFAHLKFDKEKIAQLTISDIDRICNIIDKNKELVEGIREGGSIDNKSSFETYDLKDKRNKILYRIRDYSRTEKDYCKRVFYYHLSNVIKVVIQTEITEKDKKIHQMTTLYYDKNKLIKQLGEKANYQAILKLGLEFQTQFKMTQ